MEAGTGERKIINKGVARRRRLKEWVQRKRMYMKMEKEMHER